jgi:hypothetical protein
MAYDLAVVIAAIGVVGVVYVAWEIGQWLTDTKNPPKP